jgi:hypothetical protein
MGDAMLLRTKQTGDSILLRANKRGMLCFSEQTNGGCYASQNSSTNVVPFVINIIIYLRRISYQRFKLIK